METFAFYLFSILISALFFVTGME